jgi:wyosine [tRNA(Phe)-imidazoG37] synthetase (radical SAM superfamily)
MFWSHASLGEATIAPETATDNRAMSWMIDYSAARNGGDSGPVVAMRVGPAVRRFVEPDALKPQVVAVTVLVKRIENRKRHAGKILGGGNAIELHGLVTRNAGKKIGNLTVVVPNQKCVVPQVDHMSLGDRLDFGKIHHHAVVRPIMGIDDSADECDFQCIAVPVQVPALALVIGDSMAGVEFEAAGNAHGRSHPVCGKVFAKAAGERGGLYLSCVAVPPAPTFSHSRPFHSMPSKALNIDDHSRDSAGMRYVYPVVSRRAGGVSIGINLNPNNACNWRCIYCQVPDLVRGGPPPIDMGLLERELDGFLRWATTGDFMATRVAAESRRLVDVAFSGNGEPTSAAEFAAAVALVGSVLADHRLGDAVMVRLITNGSLLDRKAVQLGVARIGAMAGEVWFKLDAATATAMARINGSRLRPEAVARRLGRCAELAPTWVQTCLFVLDGEPPQERELQAYLDLLAPLAPKLAGVHLYGLARPSLQPDASRLGRLGQDWMESFARRLGASGLMVKLSP